MKAELILVISAVLINHIEAVCDSSDTDYTACKSTYSGVNKAGVTRTDFCAAATAFKTCATTVAAECTTVAETTITGDTATLKFVDCAKCDPSDADYTTCTTAYDGVNKAGVTRTAFCAAATTFKSCAKAVLGNCETNAQTTITTDTATLKFTACGAAVTTCDPNVAGYATCKTAYNLVRNKQGVTSTEFCVAATVFKTCAKTVVAACETNAQATITADTTTLKFTACGDNGGAAGISISLSLMVLTFVAVLKNYL